MASHFRLRIVCHASVPAIIRKLLKLRDSAEKREAEIHLNGAQWLSETVKHFQALT